MLIKFLKPYIMLVFTVFSIPGHAEDIDIFLNPPISNQGNPNVLFILDNTANGTSNWSAGTTKFDVERQAIRDVVADLDENINVGLMLLTSPSQGSYVHFGVRPMNDANKELFTKVLNNLNKHANGTSGAGVYGMAMFEAYKYFGGGDGSGPQGKLFHGPTVHSGRVAGNANKLQDYRDYKGNPLIYGLPGVQEEPLLFYIETMGVYLDNYPVYTISCGADVVATAMVTPGIEVFVPNLTCPTPDGAWSVTVQSTGFMDMVTWYLRDANGVNVFSGGPYGYGSSDTRVDLSGGLINSDGFALESAASTTYLSPITESCGKNYIILISNGSPPTNSDNAAAQLLKNIGGDTTVIQLPSARSTSNYGDEFARFLYDTDVSPVAGKQNIVTYTMAVFTSPPGGQDPANIELMKSVANQGKGRYFPATDAASIKDAIVKIFEEVQAVDSVFASVTLPVSVNVRGTHLNQVYMGVFRPDAMDMPRWPGNLKHFKLKSDSVTGEVFLSDVNGKKVHSEITGFIVSDAESYWTKASTFWSFAPSGVPASPSDLPDGPIVEKGGVAQQIRLQYAADQSTRKVFTQNMIPFTPASVGTGVAMQAKFGASSAADLTNLINWVRGADNFQDENNDGNHTGIRASIHGDVLHSQPAVINYSADNNDVVAFYGANDGLLRAVQAGDGPNAGKELWAYVPEEFYGKLDRLRKNNVPRSAANPKPYFFDGPITTLIYKGEYYIFVTSRRGGDVVYAFNVTDPADPEFLWKLTSASSNMSEFGQSWSAPSVAIVQAHEDPVLIMGGGYDDNQDQLFPGNDSKGRAIYAIDALTGNVLWQAGPNSIGGDTLVVPGMKYSIPSDITVFDRNGDGFKDRGYVGDMGGNIWRLDMHGNFADWKVSKIATLGYDATVDNDQRRKFFYAVDVAFSSDENGKYDAVLVGSGDREKPFEDRVENRFFMIKDRSTSGFYTGSTLDVDDLYDATANLIQEGSDAQKAAAAAELLQAEGAYFDLLPGEKVISKAVTLGGVTLFNTNQPESTAGANVCDAGLGVARLYQVNFKDLSGAVDNTDRFVISPGGGLPPSPTGIIFDDGGKIKEVVCVGTKCQEATNSNLGDRIRAYWTELLE